MISILIVVSLSTLICLSKCDNESCDSKDIWCGNQDVDEIMPNIDESLNQLQQDDPRYVFSNRKNLYRFQKNDQKSIFSVEYKYGIFYENFAFHQVCIHFIKCIVNLSLGKEFGFGRLWFFNVFIYFILQKIKSICI